MLVVKCQALPGIKWNIVITKQLILHCKIVLNETDLAVNITLLYQETCLLSLFF